MRNKKKGNGRIGKISLLLIGAGLLIKVLSASGADKWINSMMNRAANSENFLKYAMSQETQMADGGDVSRRIAESFCAESAIETEKAPKQEETSEKRNLTVWEYTPGGAKKENTYPIEDITINPQSEKGYVRYNNIWVKNDSTKGIDLKWLLGAKLPFKLTGKGPHVLIVHTHGSESYFPQGKDTYALTDVERTSDKRYNVIRVGDELSAELKANGISVIHDRNIYDSPSYNGSYTRTLAAIGKALKENPSIKVIVDLHRDSMTTKEGVKYRTVADIGGKKAAQMMIVMSTGESGLPHPNWAENLKLAVKLQNSLASKYPSLMRPMNLRKERFNMHATTGSMLVEVGTSANSLSEAIGSAKLLGKELAEILKTAK